MSFHIRIKDKTYSSQELKERLDKATPTFNNWSGARKIHLADGEDYKYDEILAATLKTAEQQKNMGSLAEHDNIHTILSKLKGIKDTGHENTGVFYTFFRRTIPNMFRDRNLQKLENKLNSDFPSTEQLKTYIIENRKKYLDFIDKNVDGLKQALINDRNKLQFKDYLQLADYLINKEEYTHLKQLFSNQDPFIQKAMNEIFDDGQLSDDLNELPSTISLTPKESKFYLNYYSNAEKITFWDSYLESYTEAVNSNKWDNIQGLLFLNEELQMIRENLQSLLQDVQNIPKNDSLSQEYLKSISDLEKFTDELLLKTNNSLAALEKKIASKLDQHSPLKTSPEVKGFYNVGNTCYINSALQPLLAIKDFEKLVPDTADKEPEYNFREREAILVSFKNFLKVWKEGKPSKEMGQMIGNLRRQIFEAELLEGGFLDKSQERSFQDAGQFFELILHVLGRGFQLEITRIPVMDNGTVIGNKERIEQTPQGVFYLQSLRNSLQEIVDGHQEASAQTFTEGNEWRVEHPKTQEKMELSHYKEMQKIVGTPPEILVVRVDNHVVIPDQDQRINFAALFKEPLKNCEYELVGFSQNHNQVHWTSTVYDGTNWNHCNDDNVIQVAPTDRTFKHPANYMVYKKKT